MSSESGLQAFCSLSHALLGEEIGIKDFRLAKANRDAVGVIYRLWNILHGLTCYESSLDHHSDDIVYCTKLKIGQTGYRRIQLYCLPKDKSRGSKELLLALCWIISNQGIEKKIDYLISMNPFVNDFFVKEDVNISSLQDVSDDSMSSVDTMNSIIYLAGKIKLKLNFIQDLLLERSSLINKVQQENNGFTLSNRMAIIQLLIMSRSDCVMTPDETLCYSLIEFYIEWALKAKHFFSWFDSLYIDIAQNREHIKLSEAQIDEFKHIINVDSLKPEGSMISGTCINHPDDCEELQDAAAIGPNPIIKKKPNGQSLNQLIELNNLLNDMKKTLDHILIIDN